MNPFDVIDQTCVTQFDDCADVIVVGLGIAGACAAIEAKRAGGDVIAVERASAGGGASALSSGLFYLGGGTAVQQACGYNDDAQNMYQFMTASMGCDNAQAVRQYCDQNVEHFNWLEQQGVPFERSCYKDKAVFLMGTEGLLSTGNEKVWPYREMARPVPRGHQVTGEGESTGNAAMQPLLQVCSELGVRGYYDTRVQGLITDQSGTVVGVKTQQGGDIRHLKANKGVVLATGGFAMNPDMVQQHLQGLSATAQALGSAYSDGSGIQLGVAAGADTDAMQNYIATASIYPPGQLIKGIIVNENGQRFVAEDSYHGRTAEFIAKQSNQRAFLIVDSEIFAYPEIETARHQLIDGYETIEEMEQALAMPKGALVATLNQYNTAARDGVDPAFMKHPEWLKPLDKGPYAAFDISFSQSIYLYMTLGGLKTNANAQVLNTKGIAIPGLYAAGACSAHIPKSGASYASGMSLGPGSFFGRVAGRHIMSSSNEDTP